MDEGLLDTTFFIDYLRRDFGAWRLWRRVTTREFVGHVSSITVTELWAGVNSTPAEETRLLAMLRLLKEVPFTSQAAMYAGLCLRALPRKQAERLALDAVIGSSALYAGLTVYTRNVRDMDRFAASVRRY